MGRLYDGRRDRPVAWWQIKFSSKPQLIHQRLPPHFPAIPLGLFFRLAPNFLHDLMPPALIVQKPRKRPFRFRPAPDFTCPLGPTDVFPHRPLKRDARVTVPSSVPKGNRLLQNPAAPESSRTLPLATSLPSKRSTLEKVAPRPVPGCVAYDFPGTSLRCRPRRHISRTSPKFRKNPLFPEFPAPFPSIDFPLTR
jgi:hypothetical protein